MRRGRPATTYLSSLGAVGICRKNPVMVKWPIGFFQFPKRLEPVLHLFAGVSQRQVCRQVGRQDPSVGFSTLPHAHPVNTEGEERGFRWGITNGVQWSSTQACCGLTSFPLPGPKPAR